MQRRHFLGLLCMAPLYGFAAAQPSIAYDGDEFDLGRAWQVREYEPNGSVWEGTWTRRRGSPIFDAQWRNSDTGAFAEDVIEFHGVENGSVVLHRSRLNGTYYGPISRDGRHIRRGTASWYRPGNYWEARILY